MMRDGLLLAGRVLLGLIFVLSGISKLTGLDAFAASLGSRGVPIPGAMAIVGGLVETLGGLAVVLGIETRAAAVVMILFTVVATLISHRFWEFTGAARPTQYTQFMKNVSIVGGFVLLAACGGGRFGLEALWRRKP